MLAIFISLVLIILSIVAYIIHKAWKANQFWQERGVPHIKPLPFFGNSLKQFLKLTNIHEGHMEVCKKYPKEPVVGVYDYAVPRWVIKDVDYAERILIKDFSHFVDRGFPVDESNPLNTNLALMTGKKWRAFRIKSSPMFTSGKMKNMFETMSQCGDELVNYISNNEVEKDFNMQKILSGFALDVIATCAFGIGTGNITNPDSQFSRMAYKMTNLNLWLMIKYILITNIPWLPKLFGITFNDGEVVDYFAGIIKNTIKFRESNNIQRNDFIQMMIQLKNKGYVEIQTKDTSDDYLNLDLTTNYKTESFEITQDLIVGHSVTFLTAGFEGVTITMNYALYEISKHQNVQEKIRDEIRKVISENGSITYEAVKEMVYLEQCIKETLRLHPATPAVFRVCTKEYTLPNGFTIKPGEPVMVSKKWFHFDPKYFPEPEKFKPERFHTDHTYPICAWMPFGQGPRMCIGMRFALNEVKLGLSKLLIKYKFQLSPKTKEPLEIDTQRLLLAPKHPILYNITKI